jgi:hypothetical protein
VKRIGVWACRRMGAAAQDVPRECKNDLNPMNWNIPLGSIGHFESTDGLASSYAETPTRPHADTLG